MTIFRHSDFGDGEKAGLVELTGRILRDTPHEKAVLFAVGQARDEDAVWIPRRFIKVREPAPEGQTAICITQFWARKKGFI